MCPVCVATIALFAVGATSSGGLTAVAVNKFQKKRQTQQTKERHNETSRETNRNRIDLVPKGRDENPDSTMDWVRRHDQYDA
jgi:predicted dithiol-disulfide oxidoreductase (DUF899 family)